MGVVTISLNALSTFGGMNPANLDAMGGGQGLTYQTPTGLVTQGDVKPTGGSTSTPALLAMLPRTSTVSPTT